VSKKHDWSDPELAGRLRHAIDPTQPRVPPVAVPGAFWHGVQNAFGLLLLFAMLAFIAAVLLGVIG